MKWKLVENKNIADIMLKVYGKDKQELFINLLKAFSNIITDQSRIKPEREISIKIAERELPELVSEFINELIYLKDTSLTLFNDGEFKFSFTEKGLSLYAKLVGQKIKKNLPIKTDIKALALHKFKVEKKGRKYQASLVFDL